MASDHEENKPGKCPSKKKIEGKEKKVKSRRNSRNQNNSDEEVLHVSSKGRIIKEVKPKIINWKQKFKIKSEVREDKYLTKVIKKKGRKKKQP